MISLKKVKVLTMLNGRQARFCLNKMRYTSANPILVIKANDIEGTNMYLGWDMFGEREQNHENFTKTFTIPSLNRFSYFYIPSPEDRDEDGNIYTIHITKKADVLNPLSPLEWCSRIVTLSELHPVYLCVEYSLSIHQFKTNQNSTTATIVAERVVINP